MAKSVPVLKVAIVYGFAEGHASGKTFRHALVQAGYHIEKDPTKADVIIAHSGGCFVLPHNHSAKLVILIGLPHWPKKSLPVAIVQKVWADIKLHRRDRSFNGWLKKTGWNLVYGGNIARNLRMLHGKRKGHVWNTQAAQVVLVRNHEDTFCTPAIDTLPFKKARPVMLEVIGQHDDCWIHPAPYLDIIYNHTYGSNVLDTTTTG